MQLIINVMCRWYNIAYHMILRHFHPDSRAIRRIPDAQSSTDHHHTHPSDMLIKEKGNSVIALS